MSDRNAKVIEKLHLGLMDYQSCLDLQNQLHAEVVAGKRNGVLIFVEHPPTLTLGKNASPEFLLRSADEYNHLAIKVVATDRGGEVTAHEPGQLVAYPILPLGLWHITPRQYVSALENTVISVLGQFGVQAATDSRYPGVWVGAQKICAVGIRIKNRVSLHGIALNIANDLTTFSHIMPCGIRNRGICRLQDLVSPCPDIRTVAQRFGDEFANRLGLKYIGVD